MSRMGSESAIVWLYIVGLMGLTALSGYAYVNRQWTYEEVQTQENIPFVNSTERRLLSAGIAVIEDRDHVRLDANGMIALLPHDSRSGTWIAAQVY
jgi:hypothetical protein